jgi:hypothetical protein
MWAAHPRRMGQQVTCRIVATNKGPSRGTFMAGLNVLIKEVA